MGDTDLDSQTLRRAAQAEQETVTGTLVNPRVYEPSPNAQQRLDEQPGLIATYAVYVPSDRIGRHYADGIAADFAVNAVNVLILEEALTRACFDVSATYKPENPRFSAAMMFREYVTQRSQDMVAAGYVVTAVFHSMDPAPFFNEDEGDAALPRAFNLLKRGAGVDGWRNIRLLAEVITREWADSAFYNTDGRSAETKESKIAFVDLLGEQLDNLTDDMRIVTQLYHAHIRESTNPVVALFMRTVVMPLTAVFYRLFGGFAHASGRDIDQRRGMDSSGIGHALARAVAENKALEKEERKRKRAEKKKGKGKKKKKKKKKRKKKSRMAEEGEPDTDEEPPEHVGEDELLQQRIQISRRKMRDDRKAANDATARNRRIAARARAKALAGKAEDAESAEESDEEMQRDESADEEMPSAKSGNDSDDDISGSDDDGFVVDPVEPLDPVEGAASDSALSDSCSDSPPRKRQRVSRDPPPGAADYWPSGSEEEEEEEEEEEQQIPSDQDDDYPETGSTASDDGDDSGDDGDNSDDDSADDHVVEIHLTPTDQANPEASCSAWALPAADTKAIVESANIVNPNGLLPLLAKDGNTGRGSMCDLLIRNLPALVLPTSFGSSLDNYIAMVEQHSSSSGDEQPPPLLAVDPTARDAAGSPFTRHVDPRHAGDLLRPSTAWWIAVRMGMRPMAVRDERTATIRRSIRKGERSVPVGDVAIPYDLGDTPRQIRSTLTMVAVERFPDTVSLARAQVQYPDDISEGDNTILFRGHPLDTSRAKTPDEVARIHRNAALVDSDTIVVVSATNITEERRRGVLLGDTAFSDQFPATERAHLERCTPAQRVMQTLRYFRTARGPGGAPPPITTNAVASYSARKAYMRSMRVETAAAGAIHDHLRTHKVLPVIRDLLPCIGTDTFTAWLHSLRFDVYERAHDMRANHGTFMVTLASMATCGSASTSSHIFVGRNGCGKSALVEIALRCFVGDAHVSATYQTSKSSVQGGSIYATGQMLHTHDDSGMFGEKGSSMKDNDLKGYLGDTSGTSQAVRTRTTNVGGHGVEKVDINTFRVVWVLINEYPTFLSKAVRNRTFITTIPDQARIDKRTPVSKSEGATYGNVDRGRTTRIVEFAQQLNCVTYQMLSCLDAGLYGSKNELIGVRFARRLLSAILQRVHTTGGWTNVDQTTRHVLAMLNMARSLALQQATLLFIERRQAEDQLPTVEDIDHSRVIEETFITIQHVAQVATAVLGPLYDAPPIPFVAAMLRDGVLCAMPEMQTSNLTAAQSAAARRQRIAHRVLQDAAQMADAMQRARDENLHPGGRVVNAAQNAVLRAQAARARRGDVAAAEAADEKEQAEACEHAATRVLANVLTHTVRSMTDANSAQIRQSSVIAFSARKVVAPRGHRDGAAAFACYNPAQRLKMSETDMGIAASPEDDYAQGVIYKTLTTLAVTASYEHLPPRCRHPNALTREDQLSHSMIGRLMRMPLSESELRVDAVRINAETHGAFGPVPPAAEGITALIAWHGRAGSITRMLTLRAGHVFVSKRLFDGARESIQIVDDAVRHSIMQLTNRTERGRHYVMGMGQTPGAPHIPQTITFGNPEDYAGSAHPSAAGRTTADNALKLITTDMLREVPANGPSNDKGYFYGVVHHLAATNTLTRAFGGDKTTNAFLHRVMPCTHTDDRYADVLAEAAIAAEQTIVRDAAPMSPGRAAADRRALLSGLDDLFADGGRSPPRPVRQQPGHDASEADARARAEAYNGRAVASSSSATSAQGRITDVDLDNPFSSIFEGDWRAQ